VGVSGHVTSLFWDVRSAAVGDLYLRPTATDRGFDISSNGNDDLTELAAVLQIAVHFHHIVELECTIDDRLERATREALGDVLSDLPACVSSPVVIQML
jgi:hypothetical protein